MRPLLLATALLASPVMAQSVKQDDIPAPISFSDAYGDNPGFVEKIGPRKLLAFTAANAFEKLATRRCIHKRTCEESGPGVSALFGKRPSDLELVGAFAIDEAIYVGGSVLFGEALGYESTATRTFQVGMIGAHGVIGTMNLRF